MTSNKGKGRQASAQTGVAQLKRRQAHASYLPYGQYNVWLVILVALVSAMLFVGCATMPMREPISHDRMSTALRARANMTVDEALRIIKEYYETREQGDADISLQRFMFRGQRPGDDTTIDISISVLWESITDIQAEALTARSKTTGYIVTIVFPVTDDENDTISADYEFARFDGNEEQQMWDMVAAIDLMRRTAREKRLEREAREAREQAEQERAREAAAKVRDKAIALREQLGDDEQQYAAEEVAEGDFHFDAGETAFNDGYYDDAQSSYGLALESYRKALEVTPERKRRALVPRVGETRRFAGIDFVWIPPGGFMMGSPGDARYHEVAEGPQRSVEIKHGFWLGKYPITQEQWQAVMDTAPGNFESDPKLPVENVSWNDCQEFIQRLNAKGVGSFRLPSEAEWEYACRAGTDTCFYWGDEALIDEYAWYIGNSGGTTQVVGQKKPNAWNLHDMAGNVWEWCEDDWHENYNNAPPDGQAWVGAHRHNHRVLRGGSWNYPPRNCRSPYRNYGAATLRSDVIGFRLLRLP